MNRTILAMVAAIVLSGCGNADSAKTTRTAAFGTDDEAAVRRLVDGFAKTWNQHDMNAMHELDTNDVEWINVVGHYWRGKATVHLGHAAVHMPKTRSTKIHSLSSRGDHWIRRYLRKSAARKRSYQQKL